MRPTCDHLVNVTDRIHDQILAAFRLQAKIAPVRQLSTYFVMTYIVAELPDIGMH